MNNDCPSILPPSYQNGALITQPHVYVVAFSDQTQGLSPSTGFVSDPTATTTPSIGSFIGAALNSRLNLNHYSPESLASSS